MIPVFRLLVETEPGMEIGWRPPVDVYRCRNGWLAKFDLAGVRPADIEIRTCGKKLTVSGTRRDWAMELAEGYYSMEISYNRFQRSIDLPVELDQALTTAEYRDGMLLVRLQWRDAS